MLPLGLVFAAAACGIRAGGDLHAETPVVPPGLRGIVLYVHDAGLWTLDLQTKVARQIIPAPDQGQVNSARWSPNGTQVAYDTFEILNHRDPVSQVFVAGADGTNPVKVVAVAQAATFFTAPVWAPDGKSLYVQHQENTPTEQVSDIEQVDLASGDRTVVMDEAGQFNVSPDGAWLALIRTDKTPQANMSLVLRNLQTGEEIVIVPPGKFPFLSAPRFDPTSQTVLFSAAQPAVSFAPDPSAALADLLDPFQPSIAFAHGPPQDVWSIPVAGGTPTERVRMQTDDPAGAWSPDGTQLMVLGSQALWNVALNNGSQREIETPGAYGDADWRW